jgi:beta-lactamase regulating signal transducer with metallopeptidase domain
MSADILFEVAWKSMIVAPCVVALLIAMGRQAPSSRVAVGGFGFLFLLLLPAAVMAVTSMAVPPLELAAPTAPAMVAPLLPETIYLAPEPDSPGLTLAQMAALLWLAGVAAMAMRLVAGLATLRRWTDRAGPIVSSHWHATLDRCRAPKDTRLLLSDEVSAPLSWGWRSPVILIDPETLANHGEAQAVLAHEAAHLSRGDWPRLIAAKLVVALFWFNPFVWLLERLYLQDVEEAADAEATRIVEPAHYAQALLNVARNSIVPLGANSIASGALSRRIRKVLGGRSRSRWDRTWRIGALTSVAAIAGPIAAVQFAAPAVSAAAQELPVIAPAALPAPVVVATASTPAAPVAAVTPAAAVAPVAALAAVQAADPADAADSDFLSRAEIDEIRKSADEARAQASIASRDAQATAARARAEAARARAEAAIISRDAHAVAARARAEAAVALANARKDMARGADDMERGAIEMQKGAAQMREEARKLRDPAYRQQVIADARSGRSRWGGTSYGDKIPTDQELIDAIPKMEQGARKMDAGAVKMRQGAQRMREGAKKH